MSERPGTPGWLAARNARTALALLLEHGPLTRGRLGELSGLSKPTAAQLVARLQAEGMIAPIGERSGGRGPNAVTYWVPRDRMHGVAVDLREREVVSAIVDATGADHPPVTTSLPEHDRSPENDLRLAIDAAAEAAGLPASSVRIAVVGVQAAVADAGERVSLTDTLPGWPARGARSAAESALGTRVLLVNDVKLAAAAERTTGAATGARVVAHLWLGSGIGLAVDHAGEILAGARGTAGEIGYLAVPDGAAHVDPEARDLTDLVGAPAIAALLRRHGAPSLDVLLRSPVGEAAVDDLAVRILLALDPVLAIVDPDLVVLGGPTGRVGGGRLASRVASLLDDSVPAVAATAVGEDAVLAGARVRAVSELRELMLDAVAPRSTTADASPSAASTLHSTSASTPASAPERTAP